MYRCCLATVLSGWLEYLGRTCWRYRWYLDWGAAREKVWVVAKYVVAVSGGVDSVVLLDMLASGRFGQHELIVRSFRSWHSPRLDG